MEHGAEAIMTAYNEINGVPCMLMPDIKNYAKNKWGLHHVVTDGGDVFQTVNQHEYFGTDARQGISILSRRVLVCPWRYVCAFVCYFVLPHEPCRRSPDSPRRPAIPFRTDPFLTYGLGDGCAGGRLRRPDPHGELVAQQHGFFGRGARVGAVHAEHGEVAALRRA